MRVWRTVGFLILAGVLYLVLRQGGDDVVAVFVLGLGVVTTGWALVHGPERLRREAREIRASGWWLGWLIARLPGAGPKVVFILLGLAITGLGAAALVT